MEKADRQFENMRIVARERLLRHTPQEVSRKAGVRYEDGMYLVDTLGKTVSVRLPDCTVLPQLSNWHTLTLLHYLDLADGAPPSGCMISFSQYKDGLVRGGGLDRNAELIVRRDLGVLPPEELARRCLSMGAELLPSNNATDEAVLVFIAPPSLEELRSRLTGRGTESEEEVEKRLGCAAAELAYRDKYDYIIVNDDVEKAAMKMEAILLAEKCRSVRSLSDK